MIIFVLEAAWILACALYDWRIQQVPNWLFLVGGSIALLQTLAFWFGGDWTWVRLILSGCHVTLALVFWRWGFWGGADAKFWIVLAFLFSFETLFVALVVSHTILAGYFMIRSLWQHDKRPVPGIPLMSVGLLASPFVLSWFEVRG
ncbi:MAG: hypothetical protein DWQ07_17380 [Chloroflexi bacterium]|nr:MAG: hypothetical protein DWQ07_17380 [Chloroflexota bacterium]MBL1195178.1 hypothetical protein [Chloroflexota bacterium]NOH12461.1 hypothetical protein [Chloroflexota bacterium]